MPQPRYITSESQMGAPGVYVQQLAPATPIRGQRNRIVGFVGQCVRGPIGRLVVCDSYERFVSIFGGRDKNTNGGAIIGHIWKALQGRRWGRLIIGRVAAAAAVVASFTVETAAAGGGTAIARIDAANPGTWGNDVQWKVAAATDANANHWNLYVKLYGKTRLYENIDTSAGQNNINIVLGNDDATLITITKLADGRPVNNAAGVDGADTDGYTKLGQVVAAFTSVAGTDGVIADTDYTAVNGPMERMNAYVGVNACAVAGRSNSVIKNKVEALAATTAQRVWYVCPDAETTTYSDAITERASLVGDKMTYWFNHTKITDPVTNEQIWTEPFLPVMCIVSQTDPDVHPGDYDNAELTRADLALYNDLDNPTRDALDAGGVSFLSTDLDEDGNQVILPGNALTCDFAINNRDLDGRYMKDFIIDALARRMKSDVFKGNTPSNRAARRGTCSAFLTVLARSERYVQLKNGVPQFSYTNDDTVNEAADVAQGDQRERVIIQLIPKNKRILFQASIGVDAKITEQ